MDLNINRKTIPIGSVVYFVKKYGHKWSVYFGTVEEHYTSEICVQLYELKDVRYVNNIPIKDFETPTPWQKLPKGWSYNTHLFEITHKYDTATLDTFSVRNPEDILRVIQSGTLVKVQDIDQCDIEAEIDAKLGWRLVRKLQKYRPSYMSLPFYEVYTTYEEAQAVIDAHNAELQRQANLTDLEWSIEQIDNTINRWAKIYYITSTEKEKVRERIMNIDNLEDVEVRLYCGHIQWKYTKGKRWMSVGY